MFTRNRYDVQDYNRDLYQTIRPGYFKTNLPRNDCDGCLNPNPTHNASFGNSLHNKNLMDVDSELMGLTRKNSNDPNTHYKPDENKILKYINLEDGFFHQESSLLNNPPSLLRGQVKNRWENVHKDPMQNILEPFNRLGEDTYLSTMDNDDTCDK